MEHKRLTLFAGHYGSGKTNLAVNYALHLAKEGNPYFRTKDSAEDLQKAGVELISPQFANSNVDLPALPAETYRLVQDKSIYGIMDIGGDDRGAYALGRYVPFLKEEDNYRMVFVADCCRPLTKTAEDALEVMREIESACGLSFTHIVNNSNLGNETTPETLKASLPYVQDLCSLSGLPLWFHSVREDLHLPLKEELADVFPISLQKKYFDLPI